MLSRLSWDAAKLQQCAWDALRSKSHAYLDRSVVLDTRATIEPRKLVAGERARAQVAAFLGQKPSVQRFVLDNPTGERAVERLEAICSLADTDEKALRKLIGCIDPRVGIVGREGLAYWDVSKADAWERRGEPQSARVIIEPCGRCDHCLGLRSMSLGTKAELLMHVGSEPMCMATRTFAIGEMEADMFLSISLNREYRKQIRQYWLRRGRSIRILTGHEFGDLKGRRHFHDLVIGLTPDEYAQSIAGDGGKVGSGECPLGLDRFVIMADRWPFGHVHVQPVMDAGAARYCAKYVSQGQYVAYSGEDRSRFMRDMLKRRGEPILRNYVNRPVIARRKPKQRFAFGREVLGMRNNDWIERLQLGAFGRVELLRYALANEEKLLEDAKLTRSEILSAGDTLLGLTLPPDPGAAHISKIGQPRPLAVGPEDRRALAALIAGRHGGQWDAYKLLGQRGVLQEEAIDEALNVYA